MARKIVNLVVTAALRSPFMGDPTMPIDGVLLYFAMRRKYGRLTQPLTPNETFDYDRELVPIEVINGDSDQWFFGCSFAIWNTYVEGTEHYNKRFDVDVALARTQIKSLNTQSGVMKNYHVQFRYRSANHVAWHLRGDKDEIQDLLSDCTHIGKKGAHGYGEVEQWRVEELQDDYSLLYETVPTRAIPIRYWERLTGLIDHPDIAVMMRGYRPPYYIAKNQAVVVMAR